MKIRLLSWIALIIGILFIIAGVLREENLVVLQKSANICLECIGIG